MSTNLGLRIFKLPSIALNAVLYMMNPIELIALSFCSKSCYWKCKSFRNTSKMKKQVETFKLLFSWDNVIKLRFRTPSDMFEVEFEIEELIREKAKLKLKDAFVYDEGLYIPSWIPWNYNLKHDRWQQDDPKTIPLYSLTLYNSNLEYLSSLQSWCAYLSNLFNVQPTTLSLNYWYLKGDMIETIMDTYCDAENTPINRFELHSFSWYLGTIVDNYEQFLIPILEQQNADSELRMLFYPLKSFNFDFNRLRIVPKCMEIKHSNWITFKQLLEFQSETVYLCRSNFLNLDFKNLVEKWRAGWTPKWKHLMVEFKENLDADSLVSGQSMTIGSEENHRRSYIEKDSLIKIYRFCNNIKTTKGDVVKLGYHIARLDKAIATITVENNRIGWIYIQSTKPDAEFTFCVTEHTFDLN
ncbi:hypothetical protein GCK72_003913 [Caenorhabditis remanei]|uniref:Sdz-33 F-box domain-containing protein n=1 Tax=Caenorhabditis remanei TaxID=31234 RepID=A0A6A5H9S0_CAERE|nr:hypothetical protein GCK72_003913 [Caenorhabditis remanei]KAF1763967.1 hypothetical protein GCK72_003913 [Caenorhabditis remanei]